MSTRFRMNEGDWVCEEPQCANVNFARRTSCNRCGKEKPESSKKKKLGSEIGKAAAEKSKGLFSADDWQCSKCANVNWARRQQCNMCNAPKYSEVEERTGYGGGYNERENVEYIEREESDGEYDEYGRKKKQYRGVGESSSTDKTNSQPSFSVKRKPETQKTNQVIVEDGEEDEDEADLSKYDLSGWKDSNDDEDKFQKEKSFVSSSNSRSRSRSRSRSSSSDSRSGLSYKRRRSSRRSSHSRSNSGFEDRSRSNSVERKRQ